MADPADGHGAYPLSTLRHSVSHLMASAVQKLFPEVKFGFGPSIEHGFYYDFQLPEPLEEKEVVVEAEGDAAHREALARARLHGVHA